MAATPFPSRTVWRSLYGMFFLLANILFGSLFMLGIRWVQLRPRADVLSAGAVNYLVALALALPEIVARSGMAFAPTATALGATMGICYFVCFYFVAFTMRWIGASGATVIAILSIIVPICVGVFVWDEIPNLIQSGGVVLALIALFLISHSRRNHVADDTTSGRHRLALLVFLIFFLLAGTSRLAQAAFRHACLSPERPAFLLAAFIASAVPALVFLLVRRKPLQRDELWGGAVMGLANIAQVHFILKALTLYPGFIVFPVTSAGALILTSWVAARYLGETLTPKRIGGIALATVALWMLNWATPAATIVPSEVRL